MYIRHVWVDMRDNPFANAARITCENCGKVHRDENFAGEPCRECGLLLPE